MEKGKFCLLKYIKPNEGVLPFWLSTHKKINFVSKKNLQCKESRCFYILLM